MLVLATYPFSAELEPPMSVLQFIDSMAGHLAWPVVVLLLIYLLRKELTALTGRVVEMSFAGAKFKFGQLIAKGTEIVDDAPPESAEAAAEQAALFTERLAQLERENEAVRARLDQSLSDFTASNALRRAIGAIETGDTAARNVLAAFDGVERALNQAGEALGVKAKGITLMRVLLTRNFVGQEEFELYQSLRAARNAMAHGQSNLPNDAEALEFLRQASFLLTRLTMATMKIKQSEK